MNIIIITTTTSATLGFSLVVVVIIMKKPAITRGDGRWRHIITRGDDMVKTLALRGTETVILSNDTVNMSNATRVSLLVFSGDGLVVN